MFHRPLATALLLKGMRDMVGNWLRDFSVIPFQQHLLKRFRVENVLVKAGTVPGIEDEDICLVPEFGEIDLFVSPPIVHRRPVRILEDVMVNDGSLGTHSCGIRTTASQVSGSRSRIGSDFVKSLAPNSSWSPRSQRFCPGLVWNRT